jgi:hypothetical protein
MRVWLALLVFLLSCSGNTPVPVSKVSAEPPPFSSYYVIPSDTVFSTGVPQSFWSHYYLGKEKFYTIKLPNAHWSDPVSVWIFGQDDYWLGVSDYDKSTWAWELIVEKEYQFDLSRAWFSPEGDTYLTFWSEHSPAVRIFPNYEAPVNYVYATIETVVCQNVGKSDPFVVTFHGVNLQAGRSFFVSFSIWGESRGYSHGYAVAHPDYPLSVYDVGARSQGEEDYIDPTEDSVFDQIELPCRSMESTLRTMTTLTLENIEDGQLQDTNSYDYLREVDVDIPYKVPIYSLAVTYLPPTGLPTFSGQSGALVNTVMTIHEKGNFVLWYTLDPVHYPTFVNDGGKVPVTMGPPIWFRVEEGSG